MLTSLPIPVFRELGNFQNKFNEKSFSNLILSVVSVRAQAHLHLKKMMLIVQGEQQ
jgi:hypothetical protein